MSFGFVPAALGLLGLAVLAVGLFLLQRIRVRHRQVQVETTLFWQQAVEESRARVLTQRFRHPWTYVLLLLISSLLWLAFAGLQRDAGRERRFVVLLDGSAGMAHGARFDRAAAAAEAHAAGLPRGARTVLLCAGRTQTLLRHGEDALLLRSRLEGRAPVAAPNSTVSELFDVVRSRGDLPTTVCVVGDLPITAAERALLPKSVELQRLAVPARAGANVGVVALGVRPAVSNTAEAVDVLVEVASSNGADAAVPAPTLRIDGVVWRQPPVAEATAVGRRFRYADVPAKGQLLEVRGSSEDALALDDAAAFVLPDRSRIPVTVEPGVPLVLRQVLATDPGLVVRADGAAVAVRMSGSEFGGELPALELSDPEQVENAFLISHEAGLDPADVLEELYEGLGLNEIDAMAAASALGRDVSVGARPAVHRQLAVWRPLLEADFDFVRSRSFPLFVGLGVRWLAGFEEGPARVAAGEPVAVGDVEVRAAGRSARSFADRFVPAAAGPLAPAGAPALHASLLAPFATGVPRAGAEDVPVGAGSAGADLDLVTFLLLAALLLLAAEWVLYRTSRIP